MAAPSRLSHECQGLRETVGGVMVGDLLVLEVPELNDVRRAKCLFCPGCGVCLCAACQDRRIAEAAKPWGRSA